ncbi:MAG: GNAT family N-acetyltransferase [Acidobacteria bacterium]|nr:GNAT family N-acetyltransferase [Acidobacteriota bacterium]
MSVMENSVEIVDLRHLHTEAMESLLADEARAWRDNLLWDYTATVGMIRRFLDGRALTGYAAMSNGRAVGFTFYVCEAGKGLVGDVFACPDWRNDAIYSLLLAHTLETLEAIPGVRRIEAQLLHIDTPAVRALFAGRGYTCFGRSFLKLKLSSVPSASATHLPFGLVISEWEAGKFLDSANLITRSYAGHVDCEVSDQYRTQAGALRFLDNIIHYPGCGEFCPPASLLAYRDGGHDPEATPLAHLDGQPCGMLLTSVVSPGVAHITQLCVSPEQQGAGVGYSLLQRALDVLAARGFQAVTLTATDANGGAMNLYRRAGFSTMQSFPAFAWESGSQGQESLVDGLAIRP